MNILSEHFFKNWAGKKLEFTVNMCALFDIGFVDYMIESKQKQDLPTICCGPKQERSTIPITIDFYSFFSHTHECAAIPFCLKVVKSSSESRMEAPAIDLPQNVIMSLILWWCSK